MSVMRGGVVIIYHFLRRMFSNVDVGAEPGCEPSISDDDRDVVGRALNDEEAINAVTANLSDSEDVLRSLTQYFNRLPSSKKFEQEGRKYKQAHKQTQKMALATQRCLHALEEPTLDLLKPGYDNKIYLVMSPGCIPWARFMNTAIVKVRGYCYEYDPLAERARNLLNELRQSGSSSTKRGRRREPRINSNQRNNYLHSTILSSYSPSKSATNHSEIISVLWEFYTLLSSLAAVPAIYLPDANTGIHPDDGINTVSATTAGYAPETIQLMTALPYLADEEHETSIELLPSMFPITCHLTAIQLTYNAIYGTVFIYDTATKLLTPWKPFENPDDEDGYSHVAGASPREVLSPIIDDYHNFRHLATPQGFNYAYGLFANSGGVKPDGWRPDEQQKWEAAYAVWEATQKLRDLYLECGWDVDAVEQTGFNLEEFLAR
ncbi:hypothetical protein F5Y12DRAFT_790072 [Xylaria sp. FL1777]|nr:hypothetical protein F5Y12DRAFT_790072 [Xylaria sp. FL1777]